MSLSKYQEDPVADMDWFFYREDVGQPIKKRKLSQADIYNLNLIQIYFTLYLDKGGSSREMSINLTSSRNIVNKAEEIKSSFSNDSESLDGCKTKELEDLYGWICCPVYSYSLHFYTDNPWIANRLKHSCRILIGGHFAMDPYASIKILKCHLKVIKDQISSLLHLMPTVRQEYFLNPPPPPPDVLLIKELPPPPQSKTKYLVSNETDNQNSNNMSTANSSYNSPMMSSNLPGSSAINMEEEDEERRPYVCEICEKRFKTNPALRIHSRVHNDRKHFACPFCTKYFKHSSGIRKHWASIHPNELPYSCKYCTKEFKTFTEERTHIETKHRDIRRAKATKLKSLVLKN